MINRKEFTELLPKNRPYVPMEAALCLQWDTDEGKPISISGYARSWRWSRTKVRNFIKKRNQIKQPKEQPKEQTRKQPVKQAKGHTSKNENMSKNMSKDMSEDNQGNSKEDMVFPIKCELKRIGLKSRQLAERAKINESRLSSIIHGRIKPNHREIVAISKVLGVSANILFGM